MTDAPVWEDVALTDIADYLAPLRARGQGSVRDGELRGGTRTAPADEQTPEASIIWFEFTHATLGRYRIGLVRPTVKVGSAQDPYRILEIGCWEVHDHAEKIFGLGCPASGWPPHSTRASKLAAQKAALRSLEAGTAATIHASHSSIMGHERAVVHTEELLVQRAAIDLRPGACRACGSRRFSLKLQVVVPVDTTSEDTFEIPDDLRTPEAFLAAAHANNVLVSMICTTCQTPHPAVSMSRLAGQIGGIDWRDTRSTTRKTSSQLGRLLEHSDAQQTDEVPDPA